MRAGLTPHRAPHCAVSTLRMHESSTRTPVKHNLPLKSLGNHANNTISTVTQNMSWVQKQRPNDVGTSFCLAIGGMFARRAPDMLPL